MKKKILTLVCISLLHSTSYATSETPLPPLPLLEVPLNESKNTPSLWTKVLIFFGLNNEEKKENDITSDNNPKDKINQTQDAITNKQKIETIANNNDQSVKNISKQEVPNISDLKLPEIKPDEELPTSKTAANSPVANDKIIPTQDITKETPVADLKLPEIKPDEQLPTSKTAANSPVANDKIIPTQDIAKETPVADLKLPEIKPDEELPTSKTGANSTVDNDKTIPTQDIKDQPDLLTTKLEPQKSPPLTDQEGLKNIDGLNVKSYRQHIKDRLSKTKQLPKISKNDLIQADLKEDPIQIKFANDEAQVLLLPNDEVVLGEVTKESQINLMDLSSYLNIFWDNYNNIKNEPARQLINNFVDNYDSNFNTQPLYSQKEIADILLEAFKAIDKNSIYDLMNLLDIYPILQLVDHQGNTLLHKSVYKNNYSIAKFLIMKGIDISIQNNKNLTALDIAIAQKKPNIETLLRTAGADY
jgi:uncharacterized protein